MPPRYAYWTIIVDEQATAFRAGAQEDLMPTFNRLKEKHPSAKMMWFQNGKLWNSRLDAQEAMRARGELGRRGDERQSGGFRDRKGFSSARPSSFEPREKPEWKPKGAASDRSERPEWKPSTRSGQAKPAWKPKGDFSARSGQAKPAWTPKGNPSTRERFRDSKPSARPGQGKPAWKPKPSDSKLEWRPKGEGSSGSSGSPLPAPGSREKRKWVPKEEYKRSQAPSPKSQAPRDKNWRPGGEHKDPRQKYKDAKKAKWTRFKQTIRKRWEGKPGKKGSK